MYADVLAMISQEIIIKTLTSLDMEEPESGSRLFHDPLFSTTTRTVPFSKLA